MQKSREYRRVRFAPEVIASARISLEASVRKVKGAKSGWIAVTREVRTDDSERWLFDSDEEFFAGLRGDFHSYEFAIANTTGYTLRVRDWYGTATVSVAAPSRREIEAIFELFEEAVPRSRVAEPPEEPDESASPRVFIGHGRSRQWRDLKDHLQDQHGYQVVAYEVGARAGHTIRDILDEMMQRSDIAFLVMTAEDETADGELRARQNVVHELGLFQGRLGFPRAIALLEEGADDFSNLQGIHQVRFARGNIKEAFGDVLAVLRREFSV